MNVLVQNSDTSTLGGGGIPPMIDTKTTVGGSVPDYSAMMAQNQQLIAALANLQSNPNMRNRSRNRSDRDKLLETMGLLLFQMRSESKAQLY